MDNLNFIHGGNVKEVERIYNRKIIDFSSNINFAFSPEFITETIKENLESILSYPEIYSHTLKEKASKCLSIRPENILFGNGASELIYIILNSLSPERVTIPIPTFTEYERASRNLGIKVRYLKLEEETFQLPPFKKRDFLFISNPNNPTGNLLFQDFHQLLKLLSFSFLVVDESFIDFTEDKDKITLLHKAPESENILVLKSMTKFFRVPGLRLGYVVGNESVINRLKKSLPPWSVNAFAQIVGKRLFEFKNIKGVRKKIEDEKRFVFSELTKIKTLKIYPSVTNFFLIKILTPHTAATVQKELLKKGILIRSCSNIPSLGEKFIRITVLDHDKNLLLLKSLRELLGEKDAQK